MKRRNTLKSSTIISICLFSMVSSAILPQTSFAQTSPNRQISQRPLNFNQALRAYGLDKQSAGFSFTSKQMDRNQAVYRGVKFGKDSTADSLTVNLLPNGQALQFRIENWHLHEKDFSIKMQNGIMIDRSREKGIQTKVADLFGPETEKSLDFFGDIIAEKIEIQNKTDTSSPFTFEKIAVYGASTSKDKMRFDSIDIGGFSSQVSSFVIGFNSFKLSGLSDAIFDEMNKSDTAKKSAKNNLKSALSIWNKIGIELFHLGGFKVALATNSTSRPRAGLANSFGGFELASFDIRELTPKRWGHFGLLGIKAAATVSNEDIKFNLDEISFNGLNIEYFKAIYSAALSKDEASPYANLSLSDIFKGGPMDSGLENSSFKGLSIIGMGGEITLDNASFSTQKNSDGVYTKILVPRGKLEIKASDDKKPFGKILSEVNDKLGLESFKANWGGNSDYEIASDRISSNFDFKIDSFGSIDFRGAIGGAANWHKQTKIKDLAKIMAASMAVDGSPRIDETSDAVSTDSAKKPAGNSDAQAAAAAAAAEAMANAARVPSSEGGMRERPRGPADDIRKIARVYKEMWPIYKGLQLINANIEVRDLGALNKIAVNEAATKGKTPTQIRQAWREPFGQYIATKSNPAVFRHLAFAFSNFINKGGSFKLDLAPPTPFDISRFGETNLNTNEIGLKATASQ